MTKSKRPPIKVNSYTFYNVNLVPDSYRTKLAKLVDMAKESKFWKDRPEIGEDFYKGRRYDDTKRCVEVILGSMSNGCKEIINEEAGKPGRTFPYDDLLIQYDTLFSSYIEDVTDEEITMYIDSCLEYVASCDHWYRFEKEY